MSGSNASRALSEQPEGAIAQPSEAVVSPLAQDFEFPEPQALEAYLSSHPHTDLIPFDLLNEVNDACEGVTKLVRRWLPASPALTDLPYGGLVRALDQRFRLLTDAVRDARDRAKASEADMKAAIDVASAARAEAAAQRFAREEAESQLQAARSELQGLEEQRRQAAERIASLEKDNKEVHRKLDAVLVMYNKLLDGVEQERRQLDSIRDSLSL
ncbi:unnamed protein product [Peniophora sp. CBMAI 1063]|nr:unnamed protein product [Peniophora sp. CBMAI 1063]